MEIVGDLPNERVEDRGDIEGQSDVDDDIDIENREMLEDEAPIHKYPPISLEELQNEEPDFRRIHCPSNRLTPLRQDWEQIIQPIVDHLKLQIRFNTKSRCVEVRTSEFTEIIGAVQKASDFLNAYMVGFEVGDALALLRLDDLFVESFLVTDVKLLKGDHLSRAVGRIAGQDGRTKFAIENATRTRIVVADKSIHILGNYANIRLARNAICSLVLGSPPGKVYNSLRTVARRVNEHL